QTDVNPANIVWNYNKEMNKETAMALELYMLGLIVKDMGKALQFYRHLGLDIPQGSENTTHVEIKMGSGLTFFLDSRPERWDSKYAWGEDQPAVYSQILEFYLNDRAAVEAKYQELTGLGYEGFREPYDTSFGMRFAMVRDPDGNTVLLSGDL
ncbi:MAG TPA: VOC family protein, partial [Roseiflexaceae bacterium]|nr:VOC family protein [Roseiflexaceae bacterium]